MAAESEEDSLLTLFKPILLMLLANRQEVLQDSKERDLYLHEKPQAIIDMLHSQEQRRHRAENYRQLEQEGTVTKNNLFYVSSLTSRKQLFILLEDLGITRHFVSEQYESEIK